MKKLIILAVVILVALVMASPAEAAVTIKRTGPGSVNTVVRTSTKSASSVNLMLGGIQNNSLSIVNSGLNFEIGNTTGGSIESGEASSEVDNESYVNGNQLTINQAANPCCDGDVLIHTTGPGSVNRVTMTSTKRVRVTNLMAGGVENNSLSIVNSGGNVSALNTVGGGIVTGDATSEHTNLSDVNTSVVSIVQ